VYLDGRHPPNDLAGNTPIQEATGRLLHPAAQLAQAEALASLIQATLTPIIAPLVAEQAALRQTVERQAEQLIGQAEMLGRQGAELEAAGVTVRELRAADGTRRRVGRLLLAVVVLGVIALVAGMLAWVR